MAILDGEDWSIRLLNTASPLITTSTWSSSYSNGDSTRRANGFFSIHSLWTTCVALFHWLLHWLPIPSTTVAESTRIITFSKCDESLVTLTNDDLMHTKKSKHKHALLIEAMTTTTMSDTPFPARSGRARRQATNASTSFGSSVKPQIPERSSAHPTNTGGKRSSASSVSTRLTANISQPPPRKTLVLDLDETLVHADQHGGSQVDHVIEVIMDGYAQLYFIGKRPHTDYFLHKVSQWYELVIFTASLPEYADPVIDWLDPEARYFKRRLFRNACTPHGFSFAKDLTLAQADLSRVILVDNSPASYALHKENGLPISGWYDDQRDEALLDLLPVLDALRFVDDVRSILRLRLCNYRRPAGLTVVERLPALIPTNHANINGADNYMVISRRPTMTVQHHRTRTTSNSNVVLSSSDTSKQHG